MLPALWNFFFGAFFRHLADFFLNSCSAGKGGFLHRFAVCCFHFATGGKGGFFCADFGTVGFLINSVLGLFRSVCLAWLLIFWAFCS